MATIENLGEKFQGRYRWTSEPDKDGDRVTLTNTPTIPGCVVFTVGNDKKSRSALVDSEELKQMLIAILDLSENQCPKETTDAS